jgi:hypothetical protein
LRNLEVRFAGTEIDEVVAFETKLIGFIDYR